MNVEVSVDAGLLTVIAGRMLHGRTAFEIGAAGRRRLLGCYLDIDELTNRRAVLNAAFASAEAEVGDRR